jgi:hypothetical protein
MGKYPSAPPGNNIGKSSPQNAMEDSVDAALLYPNPKNANSSFDSSSHSSGSDITDQGDKASIKIVKFDTHASHTPQGRSGCQDSPVGDFLNVNESPKKRKSLIMRQLTSNS